MDILLSEAIQKIKNGDVKTGYELLRKVIGANPKSRDAEVAWLWMATIIKNPDKKRTCLENVIRINPNNQIAEEALQKLSNQQAFSDLPNLDEIINSGHSETEGATSSFDKVHPTDYGEKPKKPYWRPILYSGLGILFVCCVMTSCAIRMVLNLDGSAPYVQATLPPTYTPNSNSGSPNVNATYGIGEISRAELAQYFQTVHGYTWKEQPNPEPGTKHWSGYSDAARQRELIIWTPDETDEIIELFYAFEVNGNDVSESLGDVIMAEQSDLITLLFPEWKGGQQWLIFSVRGFRQYVREIHETEYNGVKIELDIGPSIDGDRFISILSIYSE